MLRRSQLRHTALDNGLAPLFEAHRKDGTQKVLTGEARSDEFPDTRLRLARWEQTRADVESNLQAFATAYTPFEEGLRALKTHMEPGRWDDLATAHRARMRERLGIAGFVASVRAALSAFEEGLHAVAADRMTVDELSELHGVLVDVYRRF